MHCNHLKRAPKTARTIVVDTQHHLCIITYLQCNTFVEHSLLKRAVAMTYWLIGNIIWWFRCLSNTLSVLIKASTWL